MLRMRRVGNRSPRLGASRIASGAEPVATNRKAGKMTFIPRDGIDRCECGSKYWDRNKYMENKYDCHSCKERCRLRPCEQQCGEPATVYAGGRGAGDWAGNYCTNCAKALNFIVFEELK